MQFENALEALHEDWKTLGTAHIVKVEPPVGFDKRNQRIFYKKRTGFDYMGTTCDGRSVSMEAKSSKSKVLRVSTKSDLREHQAVNLVRTGRMGAISLVLWYRMDLHQTRFVTWRHIEAMTTVFPRVGTKCEWRTKTIRWEEALSIRGSDYISAYLAWEGR